MSGSYGENVRRKSHTPSAIVIGGGFAGLAAADALRNASFEVLFNANLGQVSYWWYNGLIHFKCSEFQVILLESRDRIGGRVHTDYSFGFPVDLGASWLVYSFLCNTRTVSDKKYHKGIPNSLLLFLYVSGFMVSVKKIPWHQSLAGLDFHCIAQVEMILCCLIMIWRGKILQLGYL